LPGSTYTEDKDSPKQPVEKYIYQCHHCMTVYDEEAGEPENGIAEGTLFEALPENYCCPLCEAPKNDFEKKEKKLLGLQSV